MKGRYVLLIVTLLIAGFVVSNRMSYADGLNDQAFRCQMIDENVWPDVDGFYARVCK